MWLSGIVKKFSRSKFFKIIMCLMKNRNLFMLWVDNTLLTIKWDSHLFISLNSCFLSCHFLNRCITCWFINYITKQKSLTSTWLSWLLLLHFLGNQQKPRSFQKCKAQCIVIRIFQNSELTSSESWFKLAVIWDT